MEPYLIPAKQPLRVSTADLGVLDLSLDTCPRAYHKELLASFPDCTEALKMRPSCKTLLILAVHKTSMSMASFSPDTGAHNQPASFSDSRDTPASTLPILEQNLSGRAFSENISSCECLQGKQMARVLENLNLIQVKNCGVILSAICWRYSRYAPHC
jgi:hypothetical protein